MYLLMAIIAVVVSFSVAGAWFIDRDTVDSTMDMGGAVVVKLVGTGEDGTIQNFKQLYDSDGGAYPGDKILDSIKVQMGEKTEESVLRVQYSVDILDKEKNVKTQDLTEDETKLATLLKNDLRAKTTLFSSDWSQTTSDWIYYKHLASGKTKPIDLFDEYSLPLPDSEMDNQYQELSFRISLVAEAIQAANIMSHNEWNDDITNLSDSALMERVIKYNGERFAEVDEVLPYIETTGGQYIDTGYVANLNTAVEVTFQTNTVNKWLFGSRTSGGASNTYAVHVSSMNSIWFQMANDSSSTQFSVSNFANKQSTITVNKDAAYLNGAQIGTVGRTAFGDNSLSLYLGVINSNGSGTDRPFVGKIYSMRIWDNGELVRFFVPARDKDGNVGFYDLVTHQMFLNAGTKNFAYGHSINYIANGGTIAANAPKTFVSGDLPITLPVPTRTGYEFGGWFLSSDFSGAAQTTIPAGTDSNVYVYAKWIKTYNITYHLGGGINAEDNPTEFNERTLPLTLKAPTRDGFTFGGWYQNPAYSGNQVTTIDAGTEKNVSLWAKWNAIEYSVSYVLNGGTNSDQNVAKYSILDTPVKLYNPTRDGYLFEGWFASSDFSGERMTYLSKDNLGDVTLHAKWSLAYTITYNTNGGFNDGRNPSVFTENTETFTLFEAEKVNYSFLGWFDNEELTGTPITQIAKGTKNNIVLWAKWSSTQITVTFNPNGGGVSPLTKVVKKGGPYGELPTPTRAGYTFNGWGFAMTLSVGANTVRQDDYTIKSGAANADTYFWVNQNYHLTIGNQYVVKFYAIVDPNNTWRLAPQNRTPEFSLKNGYNEVTFVAGDSRGFFFDDKNHDPEHPFIITDVIIEAQTEGEIITFSTTKYVNSETQITLESNHTLFAQWTENVYTVTYNLDGGTNDAGNPATFKRSNLPIALLDATKDGEYFAGWYLDAEFTKRVTKIDAGSLKNIELWARFSQSPLVFDLVGSSAYSVRAANTSISGDIDIPQTYNGKPVVVIQNSAFKDCSNVTSILIPSSIKSIGINAFENCSNITETTIPEGVTLIGNNTFLGCEKLASVTLPTSLENIGANAFAGCTSLTSIVLPKNIQEIGANAFGQTSKYGNKIEMTEEFWNAGHYLSRTSHEFGTGANIGGQSETYVKINGYQTSIDTAWYVVMKNAVPVVGGKDYIVSFYIRADNCLNSINLINRDGGHNSRFIWSTGETYLPYSVNFANDGNWHKVEFRIVSPAGATTLKVRIGMDNPNTCGIGSYVEIADFKISGPQTLDVVEVFGDTPATLKNNVFPNSVSKIYVKPSLVATYKTAWAEYKDKIVGFTEYSITYNLNGGTNSTKNVSSFTKIDVPIKLYDPTKENADFLGWYATSDFSGEKVTEITTASNVTLYARWDRKMTITYVLNGGINSSANLSTITESMLPYSLMPASREYYTFISWYLDDTLTTDISIITTFGDTTIYAKWEELDPNLVFMINPDGVSYSVKASSTNISGVVRIPKTYRGKPVTTIKEEGFVDCSKVSDLILPNTLTTIERSAFKNCTSMTKIYIPSSVTTISSPYSSDSPFYGWNQDAVIYCEASSKPDGWESFWNYYGSGYLTTIWNVAGLPQQTADWEYVEKKDGAVALVRYLGTATAVTVPTTLSGKTVSEICENCFKDKTSINSIYIPSSITSVERGAISGCSALATLTIPFVGGSSTSNSFLGYIFGAWSYSNNSNSVPSSLKTVVVTGGTSIESYAFYDCSSLTSITIPNSVTSIGSYAFRYCTSMTKIYIPSSVATISTSSKYDSPFFGWNQDAVIYCGASSKPDAWGSYWNNYGSSSYSSEFLKTIWNVAGLPQQNADWEYVEKNDGTMALVRYLGTATAVTVPTTLSGKTVSEICGNCFKDKTIINNIYIPSSVTIISASYTSDSPFYGCNRLAVIYCGASSKPSGWGNGWNYYSSSSQLKTIWNVAGFPQQNSDWEYVERTDGNIRILKYLGLSTDVTVLSTLSSKTVVEIYDDCFKDNSTLTSVTIPDSVTRIGSSAFYNCRSLTSITIPNGVKGIENYSFYNCSSLTSITIPSSVTSIGYYAFYNCTAMTRIYIPSSVTTISASSYSTSPFYGWNSSAVIYCRASSKPSGWGTYWNYYGSSRQLKTIWNASGFSQQNADWEYVEKNDGSVALMRYLGTVTVVTVPTTLSGKTVSEICENCFKDKTAITSLTIPNSVTSIGSSAFEGCSKLTSITIPDSVTRIGSSAFKNCTSMRRIYIPSSVTTISASSYSYSPFYGWNSTAIIYCGASSKPSGWGAYWNYYASGKTLTVNWGVSGLPES